MRFQTEPRIGEEIPVLRSLKDLERFKASATDGDIGRVDMSRQEIRNGLEWNSSSVIGLEYEARHEANGTTRD
jgi:hypothetical protein